MLSKIWEWSTVSDSSPDAERRKMGIARAVLSMGHIAKKTKTREAADLAEQLGALASGKQPEFDS